MSSFAKLHATLGRLSGIGTVTRGVPASAAEVAALQKALGVPLPEDFVDFLRTFGALRVEAPTGDMYGDISVYGHADGELDLRVTPAAVAAHCEEWGREKIHAGIFMRVGDHGDSKVFTDDGRVADLNRGRLELSDRTFLQTLEEALDQTEKALAANQARATLEVGGLAALAAWFAPGSLTRDGATFVVTSTRGFPVRVRYGDGREFHIGMGNLAGIFYSWREPRAGATAAQVLERNRGLLCSRGGIDGDELRFRGRLLAEELDAERAAWVLHHDAGVPLARTANPRPLDAERVEPFLRGSADGLFPVLNDVERRGPSEWTARAGRFGARDRVDLGVTLSPDRGVITLRASVDVPGDDAETASVLDGFNRGLPLISEGDADVNLDLEHMATFELPRAGRVDVVIRCFENALDGKRLMPFVTDVVNGVSEVKRRLRVRDPIDWAGLEKELGIKPGPLVRALVERHTALARSHGESAWPEAIFKPRWLEPSRLREQVRYDSPWGRLLTFAGVLDATELPRQFEAMLAVRGDERDSDDCAIVCLEYEPADAVSDGPRQAIWVAPDLRAFLSLIAVGSSGALVHDEDSAAFARMRFYDYCARAKRNLAFARWLSQNGVEPCSDPLKVVTPPSGIPRRAMTTVTP